MDVQTQAVTAAKLLTALVDGTDADQLNVQTPCAEWKVRDLMNHFIGGAHMFAAGLRGEVLSGEAPDDLVGSDHRASFHAALDSFGSALAATDDLERELTLPFGTMPQLTTTAILLMTNKQSARLRSQLWRRLSIWPTHFPKTGRN